MPWVATKQEQLLKTQPFTVERVDFTYNGEPTHPFHRICCPHWVNILPITRQNEAVLIRQYRAGSMSDVLETPGGVVEGHEATVQETVIRELEEETGYCHTKIVPTGSLNPNPAFHNNKTHFFLALGCYQPRQRQHFPDPHEHIEIVLTPLADLEELVLTGGVDNALCALGVLLGLKHLKQPHLDHPLNTPHANNPQQRES